MWATRYSASRQRDATGFDDVRSFATVLRIAAVVVLVAAVPVGTKRAPGVQPTAGLQPLDVARIIAQRYPQEVSVRYIPALLWSGTLRLSKLTGEQRWAQKARGEMGPFISGAKPSIVEPYVLTSLAGHLAFSDLSAATSNAAAAELARQGAEFFLPQAPAEIVRFGRGWTDDMFMASSLWSRLAARTRDERYANALGRLLTTYAHKLQRADGLFMHAPEGPHAWGRGNGFALMGVAEALTYLPDGWVQRGEILAIYRRHIAAMLRHQADDGAWRQVVDDDAAYRELTVTAMTVTALARGVRLGWLDRSVASAIDRGWQAVVARVAADGTLRDVCPSTGAGSTRAHYLNRPVVNGLDDRGAAMTLMAALEVDELRHGR